MGCPAVNASLNDFAADPSAMPVLALMRDGRWRKARDAAKDLCKRDRDRYLGLLVESNIGLARELIGKGLVKDAATVVAYLESIAAPAIVAALREEMTKPPTKDAVRIGPNPGGVLAWATLLRLDRELAEGRAATPAELLEIDRLVIDPFEPTVVPEDESAWRVAAELAAVRTACAATGDGRWDEAQAALRGVPAQSIFRHWRMFLRGVRCVFHDQPDTARQCFAGLPANGALARAARSLAPKSTPAGPAAPTTAQVALQLAMTGQPAAWAAAIASASAAWKSGKRCQAFMDLLVGMKGAFPATQPGLPAVMTDAMLPFRERMSDDDHHDADQLMRKWDPWEKRIQRSSPDAALAVVRPACLAEADAVSQADIQTSWRDVIELWQRCTGPDLQRDSMLWQWLGENLAIIAAENAGFGGFGRPKPDFNRARAALDKAVACDPGNEAAWLSLLCLLDRQNDHKASNKLLDDLAKRFPNHKTILVRTGTQAVGRKAFDKGLAALRKALALDPLDRETRQQIAIALVLRIREYRRKERNQAPLWEELEPLLDDRVAHGQLMLSRWMARVRRALLEHDETAAATAAADAVRLAPSAAERLFAERLLAGVYRIPVRTDWGRDWAAAKRSGGHTWSELKGCLECGAFLSQIKEWASADALRCRQLALELCKAVARDGFEDDPDGLLALIDQVDALYELRSRLGDCGITVCLEYLDGALSRELEDRPKADPRLRLAVFLIDEHAKSEYSTATPKLFAALDLLEHDAAAMELAGVVTRVRALRERWLRANEKRARQVSDPWGDGDDDDLDDDVFDDDEFDDDDESGPAGDGRGRQFNLLNLLRLGVEQNDRVVREIAIDGLRQIGMSQQEIDHHVAVSESAAASVRKPPPKPRKPKQPPPNPNQPDLPF